MEQIISSDECYSDILPELLDAISVGYPEGQKDRLDQFTPSDLGYQSLHWVQWRIIFDLTKLKDKTSAYFWHNPELQHDVSVSEHLLSVLPSHLLSVWSLTCSFHCLGPLSQPPHCYFWLLWFPASCHCLLSPLPVLLGSSPSWKDFDILALGCRAPWRNAGVRVPAHPTWLILQGSCRSFYMVFLSQFLNNRTNKQAKTAIKIRKKKQSKTPVRLLFNFFSI